MYSVKDLREGDEKFGVDYLRNVKEQTKACFHKLYEENIVRLNFTEACKLGLEDKTLMYIKTLKEIELIVQDVTSRAIEGNCPNVIEHLIKQAGVEMVSNKFLSEDEIIVCSAENIYASDTDCRPIICSLSWTMKDGLSYGENPYYQKQAIFKLVELGADIYSDCGEKGSFIDIVKNEFGEYEAKELLALYSSINDILPHQDL